MFNINRAPSLKCHTLKGFRCKEAYNMWALGALRIDDCPKTAFFLQTLEPRTAFFQTVVLVDSANLKLQFTTRGGKKVYLAYLS